jgi:transglutaminase-like putative cysteine protease
VFYAITHRTTYAYASAVSFSHHLMHLRPRETPRQRLLDFTLGFTPAVAITFPRLDYYENATTFLAIERPHRKLVVTARSRVQVIAPALPDPATTPAWEVVRDSCASDVLTADSAAGEFLFNSRHIISRAEYAEYAAVSFLPQRPLLDALRDLTARIFRDFKFDPRATTTATPVEEVFRKRRGVCQDFAHLGISCLRSLGLPARYVSGYLETMPPPGKPRLVGADASHAWLAAWCPGYGWIDADPTNNVLPSDRHVVVAWGRDFSDVSPLRGVVVGGGEHRLRVSVDVAREEAPVSAA